VGLIRQVLASPPFAGEGYRKVRARLRREHGIQVSGKRVLRLLRQEGLLAPQRIRGRRKPRPHDGTIIPEAPNQRWAPTPRWPGPAAMIDSINGNPDDNFSARIVTAAACVEWDVDADGAWDRVREALELPATT
jgi:transposase InsO family protein